MSEIHNKEELLEQDLEDQAEREEERYREEENQSPQKDDINEEQKLKDMLFRVQADYDNFKKRTERDRTDMIFFIKSDIFKKILPRLDDLDRIIKNTPEDMQSGAVYGGVISLQKALLKDIESLGVQSFESIGQEINPDKHEVMTQVAGADGIIIDEFEKGYQLGDRVLRVAKVVVGNGQ